MDNCDINTDNFDIQFNITNSSVNATLCYYLKC